MKAIVIDCNIIISAGFGSVNCRLALEKAVHEYQVVLSPDILSEYKEVISRKKFLPIQAKLELIVSSLVEFSEFVYPEKQVHNLPDIKDECYLTAALASHAELLVTGNIKDFPQEQCKGVKIITPALFVRG